MSLVRASHRQPVTPDGGLFVLRPGPLVCPAKLLLAPTDGATRGMGIRGWPPQPTVPPRNGGLVGTSFRRGYS
ncbi:MAG: hypothetical protein WCP31_00585 [Chloroflexales bacterium]